MSRKCYLTDKASLSGNRVSHSHKKNCHQFLPNVSKVSFSSQVLGRKISCNVARSTMRTIDKYGGIDGFLERFKKRKLSPSGQRLQRQVLKTLAQKPPSPPSAT